MKKIKKMVSQINEELDGARRYAEKYLEYKADGIPYADKFKNMAQDELEHSNILHEVSVEMINKLRSVYPTSMDMEEKWDEVHNRYIDDAAEIKRMLTM